MIRIILDQDSACTEVKCWLDGQLRSTAFEDNFLVIAENLLPGIHQLKIQLSRPHEKLIIKDVLINDCSLGPTIYLGWMETTDCHKEQPCTAIWNCDQSWILPFANPASLWHTLCYSKIPNSQFGTNLFEKYYIFYPQIINLAAPVPKLLRDFFCQDFDFLVYPKDCAMEYLPYTQTNLPGVERSLIDKAVQEIMQNLEWIEKYCDAGSIQPAYDSQRKWLRLRLIKNNQTAINRLQLPHTWSVID